MYDPSTSPLAADQRARVLKIRSSTANTVLLPDYQAKSGDVCTITAASITPDITSRAARGFAWIPTSTNIRNVGIPGMTLHEANVLHAAANQHL